MSLLIIISALILSLAGCGKKKETDPINDNYRVFYEIFVGSFSDSDGDGTGDIRGIINRMDYLNDGDINSGRSLGVQGLWLSPVFSSPSYHKYDAADYYKIDKAFGTEEDLKELIGICHERNVKVIIDLPINHTSDANLWFSKFVNAHKNKDTGNIYYDYYTNCSLDGRKGGHTYAQIPGVPGEYYECNFSEDMPELNFDNENVRNAVTDVARYYLDIGIDGFRFDAVKYIYYSNTAQSVAFWKEYADKLREIKPDIYMVGECFSGEAETLEYVTAMNCFNFQMAQSEGFIASAAKGGTMSIFTRYVEGITERISEKNGGAMLIPFISNHDMDRSSGYLTLATKRMYMGANMYLLSPGSPFIYYGEEIGMRGSRGSANTDANRRLAMLWGDGDTVSDPIGTTYAKSKQTNGTVKEQLENEESLYNYYCRLISIRNKYPEIARGKYSAAVFDSASFGGFAVSYLDGVTGIFHNTSDSEIKIDLSSGVCSVPLAFTKVCDYIGQGNASLDGAVLTLGAQTSVIVK